MRYSLRYLMLDVALWAAVFASPLYGEVVVDSEGSGILLLAAWVWLAMLGAAIGGLFGRMRLGALVAFAIPLPFTLAALASLLYG